MKKAFLLAVCIILAGMLTMNGTFATEATQAVRSLFQNLTEWIGLIGKEGAMPQEDASFDVTFVYPGRADGEAAPVLVPGRTIDNRIAVKNQSTGNEAYFCVAFAVDESIANQLTFTSTSGYKWLDDYNSFTMNGTQYSLSVAVCTSALGIGEISDDVISAVTLSADVTTEQISRTSSQLMQMKLMAVDVETFANISPNPDQTLAETVLTKALGLDEQTFNPFQ